MNETKLHTTDTTVFSLGECRIDSPLSLPNFIEAGSRVIYDIRFESLFDSIQKKEKLISFENAGPRRKIFFHPETTTAAIVTCGGLCPGLNNVITSLVSELKNQYKIKKVLGVRYGFEGLIPSFGHELVELEPETIEGKENAGGTFLGTSRGIQDVATMVDTLVANEINLLFTVGGDGTQRGALALFEEINKRKLQIAVVGVPKTIDNDINYIDRTFGFETAVAEATRVLHSAYAEASSFRNGLGLVKVMGRDCGFIAAFSALAAGIADSALIPEIPFRIEGEHGLLAWIEELFRTKHHAVIVVAEGAGQEYFNLDRTPDSSGNRRYGDIGILLKEKIASHFAEKQMKINIKYFDPSYIIRSVPPSADDAVSCLMLAQNAVHGGMCGKSGIIIGKWNSYYTFVPMKLAIHERKKIEPDGYLWSIVKGATGQPDFG